MTLARGNEIVGKLEAEGIRATTDPNVVAPPSVLVLPPNLTFDLPCGATARWRLVALAPAAVSADRTSWELLDELVTAVAAVMDLRDAELASYVLNGKSYPAYILSWDEGIST